MKDGTYRYITHYVEYLTKFHFLRPLKSKTASDVTYELLLIFHDIGVPHVLQSDNGREFTANIIQKLSCMWPQLALMNYNKCASKRINFTRDCACQKYMWWPRLSEMFLQEQLFNSALFMFGSRPKVQQCMSQPQSLLQC